MSNLKGTFNTDYTEELFYQAWLPEASPKAVIILAHGLADHSSRYTNLVNHLLPQGYAVWTFDQRGHGRSPGQRCYINRFSDLTNDLHKFIIMVKEKNHGLPLFLLGHSLGALESAALVAEQRSSVISGLILSGLALDISDNLSKVMLSLASIISALTPRLGVQKLACGSISRDTSVVEDYVKDPLVYTGKIPARMGAEMLNTAATMRAKIPAIKLPVLLLHGAEDKMTAPSGSRFMYETVSSSDKELHIFPGCYHEIFNEPCREVVLGRLSLWLDKHIVVG